MDFIPEPRTPCNIKVIVNPQTEESFSLKWILYPQRKVFVKIITPNSQQLSAIVREMKNELGPAKYAWNVQFNWKNVPQDIVKGKFKSEMQKLFNNAPALHEFITPDDFRRTPPDSGDIDVEKLGNFVDVIRSHLTNFGAHPDMNCRTPKGLRKIHNYVKSVCGVPHLSEAEAIAIAEKL